MKPSLQEKEIERLFKLARNRMQLGQVKTVGDLCKVLGTDIETVQRFKGEGFTMISEGTPLPAELKYRFLSQLKDNILKDFKEGGGKEEQTSVSPTEDIVANAGELNRPANSERVQTPPPSLLFPTPNPKQKAVLTYYQTNTVRDIWKGLTVDKQRAVLLRCKTRQGKTYAIGQLLRWLVDGNFTAKTIAPWPIMFVTKATIVEQSRRVLVNEFGLSERTDFFITNYDSLRSRLGRMFIKDVDIVNSGEVWTDYEWKPNIHPLIVIWDECQSLKNEGSEQTKVAVAFQKLLETNPQIIQIFSSATPFSRVSQAKVFAIATQIPFQFGLEEKPVNNLTWPTFAKELVGAEGTPYEYSKAHMKKFMEKFKPYIYSFKNVRYKYKENNYTQIIDFPTPEMAEAYNNAVEEYYAAKRAYENRVGAGRGGFAGFAYFTIYRKKAELLRAPIIAEEKYKAVNDRGKAALCACAFKSTISAVVRELWTRYRVPREKISLIWGGDIGYKAAVEKRYSTEEIVKFLQETDPEEIEKNKKKVKEILKQLEYSNDTGETTLPGNFDLGPQSREKRQIEIDRFQDGLTDYCLFTFGAGGIGISLHQYKPSLKPRETIVTPIYNEMEMLQALGRAHGPNSCSVTEQKIMLFRDTIEERVLGIYSAKKSCLDIVTQEGIGENLNDKFTEMLGDLKQYNEDLMLEEEKGFLDENDFDEITEEIEKGK